MQPIVLAANGADAAAVDALTQQHAELAGTLAVKSIHVIDAVTGGSPVGASAARADLADWCRSALLPYLHREAEVLYPAALPTPESEALIATLQRQLRDIANAVDGLHAADAGVELTDAHLSRTVAALRGNVERHLAAEKDRLLPYLTFSRRATLAQLWESMRTPRDETCRCVDDDEDLPVLDVRAVPHSIRHATVFGALDAIGVGSGLVLVAPHDPLPLLAQIEQRAPGRFAVTYLRREPGECHVQLQRTGS